MFFSSDTASLDVFRGRGDNLSQPIVNVLMQTNGKETLNTLFESLDNNESVLPGDCPPYLERFFNESCKLPPWVDWTKLKRGQQVFEVFSTEISFLLFCYALPMCYSCANGAKVMHETKRFMERGGQYEAFNRRLVETAQFVVYVMSQGAFDKGGKGIVACQKIRLMHEVIRYYLRENNWDVARYGEPINQEDLAGTMLSFSSLMLDGLQKMNVYLSEEDEDAYTHCWKLIGYMVGVPLELLPDTAAEGRDLGKTIMKHQFEYSDEGQELINSLINYLQSVVPGKGHENILIVFIRYFLGEETSDLMKLPKIEGYRGLFLKWSLSLTWRLKEQLTRRYSGFATLSRKFNSFFLQGILNYMNDFNKVHFYLPQALKENWKIRNAWLDVKVSPSFFGLRLAFQRKF